MFKFANINNKKKLIMGKNESTAMFLSNIANEVEQKRELSKEDVNQLKSIFTQKNSVA